MNAIVLIQLILATAVSSVLAYGYPGMPGGVPYSQDAFEQYNILNHAGGHGPYSSAPGFGIDRNPPKGCKVKQAQLYSRHGERYPTSSAGAKLVKLFQSFENLTAVNELSFLNTHESPALNSSKFGLETTTGPFSGHASMFRLGAQLRALYGHLWDSSEKLPIFTGSQARVVDSAKHVAWGFAGDNWKNHTQMIVLTEDAAQGFNSLTPNDACPKFDEYPLTSATDKFAKSAFKKTLKKFRKDLPGANVTASNLANLMSLCFYELNVVGQSPFCSYFDANDWAAFDYYRGLEYYYGSGPGNPISQAMGTVIMDASLKLLQESQPAASNSSLYLNFHHDTDLFTIFTTAGIAVPLDLISTTSLDNSRPVSQLTPMGARLIIEKLECEADDNQTESYVRFVLNDAVYPYPNCTQGPGFSCGLEDYAKLLKARFQDPVKVCELNSTNTAPTSISFFWDWKTNPEKYDKPSTK